MTRETYNTMLTIARRKLLAAAIMVAASDLEGVTDEERKRRRRLAKALRGLVDRIDGDIEAARRFAAREGGAEGGRRLAPSARDRGAAKEGGAE